MERPEDVVATLAALRRHARDFARCYVALVEALMIEGVPEDTARYEARWVALIALMPEPKEESDPWRR